MTDELLDIDVQLLLLRYGRHKVLSAFARIEGETLEAVNLRLDTAVQKRKVKSVKKKPSVMDVVEEESKRRSDIAEPLRAIGLAFENRAFLPNLRDVQRFLERSGLPHPKLKSRTDAAPVLLRALARLTRDELVKLAAGTRVANGESDYALLARAIMGNSTAPTKTSEKDTEEH